MAALGAADATETQPQDLLVLICITSAVSNTERRRSLRRSWYQYKTSHESPLSKKQRDSVQICFAVSDTGSEQLAAEQGEHGDMMLLQAAEGYEHLWRKVLTFMASACKRHTFRYFMHADDDSFVRLDLLLPLLATAPVYRHYWGYIWDGTGNRVTAPIRNPKNKSYMPAEQYPEDFYPPFASGCGFIMSSDLVAALLSRPLPDYRLLDPPFGIHLCGNTQACVLGRPIVPVHDERVRPYRAIPLFHPSTIVQHYLRPEEMRPFFQQALAAAHAEAVDSSHAPNQGSSQPVPGPAEGLYGTLVQMGLLRR